MLGLIRRDQDPTRIEESSRSLAGLRCRVFETGVGPDLLLIASPLIHGTSYFNLMRSLSMAFHVVVLELPGSGKSARLSRAWSTDQYVEWLSLAWPDLDLRRPVLVGHSNSGAIAFRFAEKFNPLISSMVLADTIGFEPSKSLFRTFFARIATAFRELHFTLITLNDLVFNLVVHFRTFVAQLWTSSRLKLNPKHPLQTPTLVAWGLRDHTMRPGSMRNLLPLLNRKMVYLERKGDHDWLVERADSFAAAVLHFVRGRTAPGR